MRAKNFMEQ